MRARRRQLFRALRILLACTLLSLAARPVAASYTATDAIAFVVSVRPGASADVREDARPARSAALRSVAKARDASQSVPHLRVEACAAAVRDLYLLYCSLLC